jgi:hypothetical protein
MTIEAPRVGVETTVVGTRWLGDRKPKKVRVLEPLTVVSFVEKLGRRPRTDIDEVITPVTDVYTKWTYMPDEAGGVIVGLTPIEVMHTDDIPNVPIENSEKPRTDYIPASAIEENNLIIRGRRLSLLRRRLVSVPPKNS